MCDSCREEVERGATLDWSERAASLLVGGAVAAYGLVRVGLDFLPLQTLAILGCSLAVPLLAQWLRPTRLVPPEVRRTSKGLELLVSRRATADFLGGGKDFARAVSSARFDRNWLWPPLAALGLWLTALLFGRTELWVFHPEPGVVLLVDGRVAGRPLAALEETPSAGLRLRLFAGAHTLSLLSSSGEELVAVEARLGAGESHLLAAAPPRRCLFEERLDDGIRRLRRIEAAGPLTRLSRSPDAWLSPPPPPVSGVDAGLVSAVRLLDCASKALPR